MRTGGEKGERKTLFSSHSKGLNIDIWTITCGGKIYWPFKENVLTFTTHTWKAHSGWRGRVIFMDRRICRISTSVRVAYSIAACNSVSRKTQYRCCIIMFFTSRRELHMSALISMITHTHSHAIYKFTQSFKRFSSQHSVLLAIFIFKPLKPQAY